MPASSCFFSVGLQLPADAGGVLALELVARVHQAVGKLARIGEEKQARAVEVQPADCDPPARRQRGEHRAPSLRVAARDELADRLVVEQDARRLGAWPRSTGLPSTSDPIARRGALAELGHGAVDADAPGVDPALDLAARAQARRGEELLQPLSRRCRWPVPVARSAVAALERGLRLRCGASAGLARAQAAGSVAISSSGGSSSSERSPRSSRKRRVVA